MPRIFIAYATGEEQAARITDTLAKQFAARGHTVQLTDLDGTSVWPDRSHPTRSEMNSPAMFSFCIAENALFSIYQMRRRAPGFIHGDIRR